MAPGSYSNKHSLDLTMDFQQLPNELLLVLFENSTPTSLLNLVKASPRCLRILESFSTSALQRLLQKILDSSKLEETVQFQRPVAGLNAVNSLVCARNAPSDVVVNIYESAPGFQIRDWALRVHEDKGDFEHPMSGNRLLYTTYKLYDTLEREGPATHIEQLKRVMMEYYAPFFDWDALADLNQYWDPNRGRVSDDDFDDEWEDTPVSLRWDSRLSDTLPASFGCRLNFNAEGSKKPGHCEILTFDMMVCRDVICFTAEATSDLAHCFRDYMTLEDVKNLSKSLQDMGLRPGAVVSNTDLIVEEIGDNLRSIKEMLGELGLLGEQSIELA